MTLPARSLGFWGCVSGFDQANSNGDSNNDRAEIGVSGFEEADNSVSDGCDNSGDSKNSGFHSSFKVYVN
jgi:hypothetical protein